MKPKGIDGRAPPRVTQLVQPHPTRKRRRSHKLRALEGAARPVPIGGAKKAKNYNQRGKKTLVSLTALIDQVQRSPPDVGIAQWPQ